MSRNARCSVTALALLFLCTVGPAVQAQNQQGSVDVIINTPQPYDNVASAIQSLGGKVKWQYKYINAISASIPSGAMPAVRDLVGEAAISKDTLVGAPTPVRSLRPLVSPLADSQVYSLVPVGKALKQPIFPVASAADVPSEKAYAVNDANLQIRALHAAGFTGKNTVVAIVDSGVRPGYASLEADGSVIGGEDFVGDGNNFSDPSNDPHGTFEAALISGNARFPVPPGIFLSSMQSNFPGTLEYTGGQYFVDMIGSAPEAQLFIVRVFGVGASFGAPKSRIIAALESIIQLRENFDNYGQLSKKNPNGGYNIKVANLSFGTSTTNAGHTELEQELDVMIAKDILPVVAAGDGGASSLTVSSPATSFSALSVGATSPSANDRLLNDVNPSINSCTSPCGSLERPSTPTQTAVFSSRGPAADGRILPHVMAAGDGMLSQGCGGFDKNGNCRNDGNNLAMASGTSFSAPVVSGVAAVLRQEFPKASVGQIWNAIVNTANKALLGDGSTVLDQGHGVVNASAAADLIQDGGVSDRLPVPPKPDSLVSDNIEDNTNLNVVSGAVSQQFNNLKPGQRGEILYQVDPQASQVVINLTKVSCGGSPCGNPGGSQNALFGDDIILNVQSAKTSSSGFGDYFPCPPFFNTTDTTIVIPDQSCGPPRPEILEPGVMRITLIGDTTNLGLVSANVGVSSLKVSLPKTTAAGTIKGGDNLSFQVSLPPAVSTSSNLQFELRWDHDWAHYPTNDLDMYITDPTGAVSFAGATLNSPEQVTMSAIPGTWKIQLVGFYVPTGSDNFVLSVLLDGKLIALAK
jgi:subtilisin family serine protease